VRTISYSLSFYLFVLGAWSTRSHPPVLTQYLKSCWVFMLFFFFSFYSIPLPKWAGEEIEKDPDLAYTDQWGKRNNEYLSLGVDTLPVLKGRSPVQCYSDFMRAFRDNFKDLLGDTIVVINNSSLYFFSLIHFWFWAKLFVICFNLGNSSWNGSSRGASIPFISRVEWNMEVPRNWCFPVL
jgi:hypothetical protein